MKETEQGEGYGTKQEMSWGDERVCVCGLKRERETREGERERERPKPQWIDPSVSRLKMIDFGFPEQLMSFTKYTVDQNSHGISVPE